MINFYKINNYWNQYHTNIPFKHCVIDDFLEESLAEQIDQDFLPCDSNVWVKYDTKDQVKKMYTDWYHFPKSIYNLFAYLNSEDFVNKLGHFVGSKIYPDPGLYGAGCHIHGTNGVLKPHLDYNTHPKLPYSIKCSIIIYLTKNYNEKYGGLLELWEGEDSPRDKVKEIEPFFNRAVIFNNSQNSWHSVSPYYATKCYRKSILIHYLTDSNTTQNVNNRATFTNLQ